MPPLSWSVVGTVLHPGDERAVPARRGTAGAGGERADPRELPGACVHQHVELLPARRADVRHGQGQLRSHAHRPGAAGGEAPAQRTVPAAAGALPCATSGWCRPGASGSTPSSRATPPSAWSRPRTWSSTTDVWSRRVEIFNESGRSPRPYLDDGDRAARPVPAIVQPGRAADPAVPCRGRGAAGGAKSHGSDAAASSIGVADALDSLGALHRSANRQRQSASCACRPTRRWSGCETHPPAPRARRSSPSWPPTVTAAFASWISASATGRKIRCRWSAPCSSS